jgi:hypothetical protein
MTTNEKPMLIEKVLKAATTWQLADALIDRGLGDRELYYLIAEDNKREALDLIYEHCGGFRGNLQFPTTELHMAELRGQAR